MVSVGKINRAFEGCACPMGVLNREFLKKLDLTKNEIALIDREVASSISAGVWMHKSMPSCANPPNFHSDCATTTNSMQATIGFIYSGG
jgi:hypothetical protein